MHKVMFCERGFLEKLAAFLTYLYMECFRPKNITMILEIFCDLSQFVRLFIINIPFIALQLVQTMMLFQ